MIAYAGIPVPWWKQKRKEKAAVSVRDLHKLQEIAHSSDARLFYEDAKKEIEKRTAATLEKFVAMETKPIHNSVKQWVDRAVIGVKSVIGWLSWAILSAFSESVSIASSCVHLVVLNVVL